MYLFDHVKNKIKKLPRWSFLKSKKRNGSTRCWVFLSFSEFQAGSWFILNSQQPSTKPQQKENLLFLPPSPPLSSSHHSCSSTTDAPPEEQSLLSTSLSPDLQPAPVNASGGGGEGGGWSITPHWREGGRRPLGEVKSQGRGPKVKRKSFLLQESHLSFSANGAAICQSGGKGRG